MPTQYTTVLCLRLRMLPEDYAAVKAKAEAYRQPLSAIAAGWALLPKFSWIRIHPSNFARSSARRWV